MSTMPKVFIWPIVLVALAVTAAAILLLLVSPPERLASTLRTMEAATEPKDEKPTAPSVDFDQMPTVYSSLATEPTGPEASIWAALDQPDETAVAPWETSINRLLDSEEENNKVAANLIALLPNLPLEGQLEAVQHMVNLLEDPQYEMATQLLLNPSLHPDLREVLFTDLLDRPNSIKLPVLLALLGNPSHPLHKEAGRALQEAVGSDFGSNPLAWDATVRALVAQEAAEEAGANSGNLDD